MKSTYSPPTLAVPQTARLRSTFQIAPYGSPICQLADLDSDGHEELLFLQTAGQLRCPFYNDARLGVDGTDKALFCLTAVRLDGTVLWQIGTPHNRPGVPFTCHGGARMLHVEDIDGDGRPEVLVIRGDALVVLDAASGTERDRVVLPGDNFSSIFTAQFGAPEAGRQILVKVNDRAHPPWKYANPTIVYNADLSVYHEPFAVRGTGHNLVARDINGDGRDELFIGYSLLDHTLQPLWSIDFGPDFDYEHDHADEVALTERDGRTVIRYAGSEDFVLADLEGNILSTTRAGHSQNSVQGPWGPDGETRIIMNEKNRATHGLAPDGTLLWTRTDINGYAYWNVCWSRQGTPRHWAVFQSHRKPCPVEELPYESDPAWSRALWPRFMDGEGELHDVLPWDDTYAIPAGTIRAARGYDAGLVYRSLVADLDGDGLDEVLISHRERLWVFASPEAAP